ncbi:MgtC/SapB family protein, partial [Mesorhizobium sp. M7A.T.Ca.TU.009.01.3.1]
VHGLTTGAGMWLAGAIGVACGLGLWQVAGFGTLIVLIVAGFLRRFESGPGLAAGDEGSQAKAEKEGASARSKGGRR